MLSLVSKFFWFSIITCGFVISNLQAANDFETGKPGSTHIVQPPKISQPVIREPEISPEVFEGVNRLDGPEGMEPVQRGIDVPQDAVKGNQVVEPAAVVDPPENETVLHKNNKGREPASTKETEETTEVEETVKSETPEKDPTHEPEENKGGAIVRDPKARNDNSACEEAKLQARKCCSQNPMECSFGIGVSQQTLQMVQIIAQGGVSYMMMTKMQKGDSKSMVELCNMMALMSGISMPMNAFMAYKCGSAKSSCIDECEASSTGKTNARICQSYGAAVNNMAMQAVSALNAIQQAQLCKQFAQADQPPVKTEMSNYELANTQVDCADPANASNTLCLQCAGDAGLSNPLCPGYGVGDSEGSDALDFASSGTSDAASAFNVGDGDGDTFAQGNPYGPGNDTPITSPGVGASSSGGVPGGGGEGSFGGAGGGQGRGGKGYNTDVLKGERGGGGFSKSGFSRVSGFSGYGGKGRKPGLKRRKGKFDLKKFLPGEGDNAANRRLAGIAGLRGQIGGAHENIFKRVSNRMKAVCQLDRLLEPCKK